MRKGNQIEMWDVVQGRGNSEIQEVASFLEGEYGDISIGLHWTSALLAWKVGDLNPAGGGRIFAASLNGRIVGAVTLTLKNLYYGGQKYFVAEIGDAYTSKALLTKSARNRYACSSKYDGSCQNTEYINNSIFGRLAAEAIDWAGQAGVQAIYGTPNVLALSGWIKRLDFKLVNTSASKIRSRVVLTAKLLQMKKRVPGAIAWMCGCCLRFASQLLLLFPTIRLARFQITELEQAAGSEFDDLWGCSLGQGASLVKNKDWLAWRYQAHPDVDYRIYTLRFKGELHGWLVLRVHESTESKTITICDWLYKTDSGLWVAFLFNVLRSLDYQNSVLRLWCCNHTPITKELWRLFALGGAYINVIFKPLHAGENVFGSQDIFDEFSIGHSDNV